MYNDIETCFVYLFDLKNKRILLKEKLEFEINLNLNNITTGYFR